MRLLANPVLLNFGFLLRKLIERVPLSLTDECFINSSVGPMAQITRLVSFCSNIISLLKSKELFVTFNFASITDMG